MRSRVHFTAPLQSCPHAGTWSRWRGAVLAAMLLAAMPRPARVVAQGDDAAFPVVDSKKGLQVEILEDAVALGVRHAVFNLGLTSLVDLEPSAHNLSWTHEGRPYYFDRRVLERLDRQIHTLSDTGANVYLVLLAHRASSVDEQRILVHPDYSPEAPNRIGAFNTVTDEGRRHFAAALAFLSQRWSGADFSHGKVAGYIIGNEVNSHWWWSNRGEASLAEFTDDYVRTMRLAADAVRSQSNWARVYVSLDHHWTIRHSAENPNRSFGARPFLERFARTARAQGDFEWHLAYHPYPEDLGDPRFWEDETAIRSFDTPRITFRNLEVLTAFMRRPEMLYQGKPRSIILSEQGFHTPPGREGEELQAAAWCYAYRRVAALDGIDAFILHRHVDHPREGGLRLGLRRYDADDRESRPAKRIYDCFLRADQADWEDAFRFALPIVGLQSWDDARATPFEAD